MKDLPYFRWWVARAETDEAYQMMTFEEKGFYHACLNWAWVNRGIPADLSELSILMRIPRERLDAIWPRISRKWYEKDGRLLNKAQEEERSHATKKSNQNSIAAAHRNSGAGFVYLIKRPSDGSTKIGSSINVSVRLAQLRNKYRESLQLVGKFEVASMVQVELQLHDRYKSQRLNGEWFSLSDADHKDISITLTGGRGDGYITPEGDNVDHPPYHPPIRAYDSDYNSVSDLLDFEQPEEERYGSAWYTDSFERWWESYWNKTAKVKARQAYEKSIKRLVQKGHTHQQSEEFLIAAAVDDKRRFEFTDAWEWRVNLNPPTWLNQERWNDQEPPAKVLVAGKRIVARIEEPVRRCPCEGPVVQRGMCQKCLDEMGAEMDEDAAEQKDWSAAWRAK